MSNRAPMIGPIARIHAAGVGAVALLATAGWLLVVRPSAAGEAERSLTIQRLADAEPRLLELQRTLATTRTKTTGVLARLEQNHNRLGGVGMRNERLTGLTELGGSCGLRIDRVQPGEFTREGMYLTMPVRMEGVGAYPACARFLHQLLERFSDISVRSFTLDAESSGGDRRAKFGFDLVWYADPAGGGGESPSALVDE